MRFFLTPSFLYRVLIPHRVKRVSSHGVIIAHPSMRWFLESTECRIAPSKSSAIVYWIYKWMNGMRANIVTIMTVNFRYHLGTVLSFTKHIQISFKNLQNLRKWRARVQGHFFFVVTIPSPTPEKHPQCCLLQVLGVWQGSVQRTHLCESLGTCMLACFVLLNMDRWRSPKPSHLTCTCPGVTSSLLFPSYQMVGLVFLISHLKVKWEKWRTLEGSYKWRIMVSLLGKLLVSRKTLKDLPYYMQENSKWFP